MKVSKEEKRTITQKLKEKHWSLKRASETHTSKVSKVNNFVMRLLQSLRVPPRQGGSKRAGEVSSPFAAVERLRNLARIPDRAREVSRFPSLGCGWNTSVSVFQCKS